VHDKSCKIAVCDWTTYADIHHTLALVNQSMNNDIGWGMIATEHAERQLKLICSDPHEWAHEWNKQKKKSKANENTCAHWVTAVVAWNVNSPSEGSTHPELWEINIELHVLGI
jgi:hypothetical protein